jgi:hypothetical protein
MTRRKFICKLTQISSVIIAGGFTFARRVWAQKAKLRKFVRAIPMRRDPRCVKPLEDTFEQGKWSG